MDRLAHLDRHATFGVKDERVAVIGAGWAGLSVAARLCDAGIPVTVYESTRQLGGRARRVDWTLPDGRSVALDNGQHILLGAYAATLALMDLCGVKEEATLLRTPVFLQGADGFRLQAPRWPAPWHLLYALATARSLSLRARAQMVGFMSHARGQRWRLTEDCTVADLLAQQRQAEEIVAKVWAPLCVAALNTPVDQASAQVFLNVLRDSLGAARSASDMLLPKSSLDEIVPNAAGRWIAAHDGEILLGTRITGLQVDEQQCLVKTAEGAARTHPAAILAVPSHQVSGVLADAGHAGLATIASQCAALRWQPITTVYLSYPASIRLAAPMLELRENTRESAFGQWVFDKGQLGAPAGVLAVVISAQGPHQELDSPAIIAAVSAQLHDQLGLPTEAQGARVINEKRATFACVPGLVRPSCQTPARRLALAGDYTQSDYPATLETAVASGQRAAQLVIESIAA